MKSYRINCHLYHVWPLLMVLVIIFLAACSVEPEITPTSVTQLPEPTSTPTASPTSTPTDVPTITPTVVPTITVTTPAPVEYGTFYPADEEIQQIREGIAGNLPDEEETGHVPPALAQLETLTELCLRLSESLGLLNPECEFNDAWATSYTLSDVGLVYQLVSLVEGNPSDDLLQKVDTWESGVVIGGVLVYQDAEFAEFSLSPGVYVVILTNNFEFELFSEFEEPVAAERWQLRQLIGAATAPVALVTSNNLCFSQLMMQACLNAVSPGLWQGNPNAEFIQTAVENLQASGWLPPDVMVNFENALASIEGTDKVEACSNDMIEQIEQSENCFPNLVVAAIEPLSDTVSVHKTTLLAKTTTSPAIQVTELISDAVIGIGVMEVLEPLPGEVFNLNGETVDLEVGSYRVDFLELTDGSYLLQLISPFDDFFYLDVVPALGEGVLVEGEEQNSGQDGATNEVVLDAILWKLCRLHGWGYACNSSDQPARWWQYWCATWAKVGWCYANGTFLPE